MEGFVTDWLSLVARWLHVVVAIAWIGESFYFVALDNSLRPANDPSQMPRGVFGEFWHVHGGGFYHMQKYTVAPPNLPARLHWSKWPAYTTWLSGFALFTIVYLSSPNTYLIDRTVLDMGPVVAIFSALGFLVLGWIVYDALCRLLGHRDTLLGVGLGLYVLLASYVACHVFAGRAAYLIIGAMLATMMSANVAMVIIPGQRKMVDAMLRGDTPDPIYGRRGKQRSVHNTYVTLPVVFAMLSNHYAITYTHPYNWAVLALIMLAGALIRQFFVMRHRGRQLWYLPLVGIGLILGAFAWTFPKTAPMSGTPLGTTALKLADIEPIIAQRCVQCHAAHPTLVGSAPAGVLLDSADAIERNAPRIYQQAVQLKAMPLGNVTHITDAERAMIGQWFAAGAPR
ncbi:MAG: urate hydroxylase PuuD [Pararobbsia sp.]